MEWLHWKCPKVDRQIDEQALYFRKSGEFSLAEDMAFEAHLKRLEALNSNPIYRNMNGRRIKEIYKSEGLKYWRP